MDPAQPRFTANVSSSEPDMRMGWRKALVVLVGAVFLMIFWTYINSPMLVTVTGSGEVSVPATNATISFSVSATDNSVSSAVSAVQGKADSMRNYLKSKGIAEGDIAQSQVTAVPAGLVTPGAGGFQATISMAAKTIHVSEVGGIVSDLYTNGALVVAQPILSVQSEDQLNQQAFNSAMKDADSQAAKIGYTKWKFIRKIVSVSQVTSPTTSTSTIRADVLTGANNQVAATNGVFKIVKAVSVSYKMW